MTASTTSDAGRDSVIQDALEDVAMAIHWVDSRGTIVWANKAELNMLGYSRDEYFGRSIADFHADKDCIADILRRLKAGETLHDHEARLIHRDGSIREVSISSSVRWDGERFLHTRCFTRDITRHKAERFEHLRTQEAQARLAAIVESAEDAIVGTDLDSTIITWNLSAQRLYGYSADEAVGQPVTMLIPDDRLEEETRIVEFIRRGESIHHYETARRRKDGSLLNVSLSASPIRDASGRIVGASRVSRDITERIEASAERERLLRGVETERRQLADVFQRAPSFMCILRGPDHVFERANERYYQLVGRRDLLGKPVREALPEIEGQGFIELLDRVYWTGQPFTGTDVRVSIERQQGLPLENRYVNFVFQPMFGANGAVDGVFAQGVDLTERKVAEMALAESERQYRTLFESMDEGFCVIELLYDDSGTALDYRFLQANPAFERHTGLQDPVGKTQRELVPDLDESWFSVYGKVARTRKPVRFENYAPALGRWFDVFAFPVGEDADSRLVSLLFSDITKRKQAEEGLREADRRKDEFIAMLSHELRNPLAPIRASIDLLRLDRVGGPVQGQVLDVLERQVGVMTRLLNDLLDVSRVTRGKIQLEQEKVDLNLLARRVGDSFGTSMAKGRHQFSVALADTPVWVHGDSTRLEQVIVNLLSNARKYTPEGGEICLSVARDAAEAVVSVKDTGVGMAPDMLVSGFDLFSQGATGLDRAKGGLGIGLALVRALAEMHGGSVRALSEGPGKGSEFVVRLPILPCNENEGRSADAAPVGPGADRPDVGAGMRVLYVDDNRDARTISAMVLRTCGHDVCTAHDGPSALELAVEFRPHVVLLDIGLPGMDGYEVAKRIRQDPLLAKSVLVAITGYGQASDYERSKEAGFAWHLVKPVDFGTTVREVLDTVARQLAEAAVQARA